MGVGWEVGGGMGFRWVAGGTSKVKAGRQGSKMTSNNYSYAVASLELSTSRVASTPCDGMAFASRLWLNAAAL